MDEDKYRNYQSALDLLFYEGQIGWQMNIVFLAINTGLIALIAVCLNNINVVLLNFIGFILGLGGVIISIRWLHTFNRNSKYYHFRMAQAREVEPQKWSLLKNRGYRFSKGEEIIIDNGIDKIKYLDEASHKLSKNEEKAKNKKAMELVIKCSIILYSVIVIVNIYWFFDKFIERDYYTSSYWENVIQNAIGCALGSFIAIIVAIYIYYKQYKDSEDNKRKTEYSIQQTHVISFTLSLDKIIGIAEYQRSNIQELIAEVKAVPLYIPLLKYVPIFEIKRKISNTSMDKVLLTYFSRVQNNQNALKEFSELMDILDYLYLELDSLPDNIKAITLYDHERKSTFRDNCSQVDDILTQLIAQGERGADTIIIGFRKIQEDFESKNIARHGIKGYLDNFIEPVNSYVIQLFKDGKASNIFNSLALITRNAKSLYLDIIDHNLQNVQKDLVPIIDSILEKLTRLKEIRKNIF